MKEKFSIDDFIADEAKYFAFCWNYIASFGHFKVKYSELDPQLLKRGARYEIALGRSLFTAYEAGHQSSGKTLPNMRIICTKTTFWADPMEMKGGYCSNRFFYKRLYTKLKDKKLIWTKAIRT